MLHELVPLIQNAALLLAMMLVLDFVTNKRIAEQNVWVHLLVGVLIGSLSIALMNTALHFETGIIFDMRSVLLSLSGLFLGPVCTIVAMAIAGAYRFFKGGAGVWMGIWVIVTSGGIGLLWRYYRKKELEDITLKELYTFGVVVHLVMLALMFTLPRDSVMRVISSIAAPVLIIYPVVTITLGWLLKNRLKKNRALDDLISNEILFYNLFDKHAAVKLIIDPEDGMIVNANEAAENFYGWTRNELKQMRIQDINCQSPSHVKAAMISAQKRKQFYFEFKHRRSDGTIIDVGVYSSPVNFDRKTLLQSIIYDITDKKVAEENIKRNTKRLQTVIDILQHNSETVQEFLDYCLSKAIEVTESKIGYIYFYNEDKKEFILNSWSKEVMKECSIMNPQTCYELDKTGLWGEAVRQGKPIINNHFQANHPLKKGYPEGHVRLTKFMTIPIFRKGHIVAVAGVGNKETDYDDTDILQLTLLMDAVWKSAENLKFEEMWQANEKQFIDVLYASSDAILLINSNNQFIDCNNAALKMFEYDTPEQILGKHPADVSAATQEEGENSREKADKMLKLAFDKGQIRFDWELRRSSGEEFPAELSITALVYQGQRILQIICRDITRIKHSEQEREKLQSQLNQAQKMESVGRLAGGVAHDFNNMLGVIMGHTELLLNKTEKDHMFYDGLKEIEKAGQRSAELTRQLLAFAREQTITPEILNLNTSITSMLKMLERLIGEDISLKWLPQEDLWTVELDPSQVDQILANLCVNARDAIVDVGMITIETANCIIGENHFDIISETIPGEYVSLIVSDTGCGMDKDTLSNIFEPFFTTKELGEGTGLGLATVYGIVKQNNGYIDVHSEPGKGTSFNLYFPRCVSEENIKPATESTSHLKTGDETILIVEDEAAMLEITKKFLQRLGYTVFPAASPNEAISIFNRHHSKIDLLFSDIIMPGMNGKDLLNALKMHKPDLKSLFMSGHTANVISSHGVLDEDLVFIPKPFRLNSLASKIREAIDTPQNS